MSKTHPVVGEVYEKNGYRITVERVESGDVWVRLDRSRHVYRARVALRTWRRDIRGAVRIETKERSGTDGNSRD